MAKAKNKKAIARELAERLSKKEATRNLLDGLFPKQREFVDDESEFSVAVCSRQAGKTHGMCVLMLHTATVQENRNVCYMALTRKSAKSICWRVLKRMVREYNISCEFNESELTVNFTNGSIIQLTGANDQNVAETLRGVPWDLAVIDEAASFRGHIEYLIDECIAPSFITRRGKLRMIGTPSADFTSYFYKAFHTLSEYTRHRWTTIDNISIPDVEGYLTRLRKKKGWTENNPVYLREYEGQFVRTEENLVYQYNPLRNQCSRGEVDAIPNIRYVLGVDLGWNDANALVVLAYNPEVSRNLYVVNQFKKSGQLISELGEKIKELDSLYRFEQMVCDGGGLGRSIIEELNTRFGLRLVPAEKTSKLGYISLLNADLERGYLKIVDEEIGLGEEWLNLQWKDDSRKAEDPKCDNHLCFVKGTLIQTPIGPVAIDKLRTGDYVIAASGQKRRITAAFSRTSEVLRLTLSNGVEITCTPDHPFWSQGRWIQAKDLLSCKLTSNAENTLNATSSLSRNAAPGPVVVAIEPLKDKALVYNITVEIEHNYWAEGVLVSNCDAALYAWRAAYAYAFEAKESTKDTELELLRKRKAEWADEDDTGRKGDGFDDWRQWD